MDSYMCIDSRQGRRTSILSLSRKLNISRFGNGEVENVLGKNSLCSMIEQYWIKDMNWRNNS